jgi:hypothetical protein
VTRSEMVKFRVSPRAKAALFRLADRGGTTVSVLLRDQTSRLTTGRTPDPEVRADLARVRQLANLVISIVATSAQENPDCKRLSDAANDMHRIIARHLGPA